MDQLEANLNARLQTALVSQADASQLGRLWQDAVAQLGCQHWLVLQIECDLTAVRMTDRPVGESLAAWTGLRQRAGDALPSHHPTSLSIRAQYTRCLAYRGEPGDLDRVVELCRDELATRIEAGVADTWIGAAVADLAVARLDRGRFAALDPLITDVDVRADIAMADEALRAEVKRRTAVHGPRHRFTWRARGLAAASRLALAHHVPVAERRAMNLEVLGIADAAIEDEWQRTGTHTSHALRAQLLRAQALLALGRDREASHESRLAAALARRYRGDEEGSALLVLAASLAALDLREALVTAQDALAVRLIRFPPTSHQVAEAEHLIARLADHHHEGLLHIVPNGPESLEVHDRYPAVTGADQTLTA